MYKKQRDINMMVTPSRRKNLPVVMDLCNGDGRRYLTLKATKELIEKLQRCLTIVEGDKQELAP